MERMLKEISLPMIEEEQKVIVRFLKTVNEQLTTEKDILTRLETVSDLIKCLPLDLFVCPRVARAAVCRE